MNWIDGLGLSCVWYLLPWNDFEVSTKQTHELSKLYGSKIIVDSSSSEEMYVPPGSPFSHPLEK